MMRKSTKIYIHAAVIALVLSAMMSCSRHKPIKVLVMHQYSKELANYEEFDCAIKEAFKNKGYKPEIMNFYMAINDQEADGYKQCMKKMSDSLSHTGWKADVILAEGDRCYNRWKEAQNDTIPKWRHQVPTVFGGIMFDKLIDEPHDKNTILYHEIMNMNRNIDLITEITGKRLINVELDRHREDSLLFMLMNEQLSDHPYSMTTDSGRIKGDITPYIIYKGDTRIYFHSSEWNKTTQAHSDQYGSYIPSEIDSVYVSAWKYPVLVVKKDVWGENIALKTTRPQFTTRREVFNDYRHMYLGGYFTSYTTIANDIVSAAVDKYEGKQVDESTLFHKPNYYMDYYAMQKNGMKLSDYKDKFIIIGTPLKARYPLIYNALAIIITAIIIVALLILYLVIMRIRKNSLNSLTTMLVNEKSMTQLAIDASGNHYISSADDLRRIVNNMADNQEAIKEEILASMNKDGTNKYSYRIRTSMDEDKNMSWWNLRFVVDSSANNGLKIEGYLLNVNDDVNYENQMQSIRQMADETKRAEGFLWSIAYEIRTPLNAIIGFCDLITMMGDNLDKNEMQAMAKDVNMNDRLLSNIIGNIQDYSHIKTGDVVYNMQTVKLEDLFDELYKENENLYTNKNIGFFVEPGRSNIEVVADRDKLKKAMNQLIDNAWKFTEGNGNVAIGWQFNLNEGMVELWVEDNGNGVSKEDQEIIFDMFWKKDTFIPGVGIGLTIAKEYVVAMGGTLNVESEVGEGSRFYILMSASKDTEQDSGTPDNTNISADK